MPPYFYNNIASRLLFVYAVHAAIYTAVQGADANPVIGEPCLEPPAPPSGQQPLPRNCRHPDENKNSPSEMTCFTFKVDDGDNPRDICVKAMEPTGVAAGHYCIDTGSSFRPGFWEVKDGRARMARQCRTGHWCKDLGNKEVECVKITNEDDLKYYKEKTGEPSNDQGPVGIPKFIEKEMTSNGTA